MTEIIIGFVVAVGTFVVGIVMGGSRAKLKHEQKRHDDYVETGKRIDEAFRDSDGSDAEWLRDRSER